MRNSKLGRWVVVVGAVVMLGTLARGQEPRVYRLGPLSERGNPEGSDLVVRVTEQAVDFEAEDYRVAALQVTIRDRADTVVFESGAQPAGALRWDLAPADREAGRGPYRYRLTAWDGANQLVGTKRGEVNLVAPAVAVDQAFSVLGDFTIGGYLGVGTETPARAVHLVGPNAVFRMDRSVDTAAFILSRTDELGNPLKTFVVGANASGPNVGEFIINDIGAAVGGMGQRRMTITNNGDTIFGGTVTATQYFLPSSVRFKENVRQLEDPIGKLEQLRGVRFSWKETGKPGLGVIAEDVAQVLPEAVSWDAQHEQVVGVNYDSLVALLVETAKVQQNDIDSLTTEIDQLTEQVKAELAKSQRLNGAQKAN